ncbi:MAG: hypothetical protein JWR60_1148 [Polaromonas sp.]|nr:hypothetical protein [Polaromonas sp.]
MLAARDAFAGSPGFAVEYIPSPDALPAWPVLRSGFLGSASADADAQLLGIDLPAGPRGGPVFDGTGQLIGLALPGGAGGDRLVTVSQLRKALASAGKADQPASPHAPVPAGPKPRASVDQVYEDSLKTSLQVITAP